MSVLTNYLKSLNRRTKDDDLPGSVLKVLDEPCPLCGRNMKLYRPCCGAPNGTKECKRCDYKVIVTSDSDGGNS